MGFLFALTLATVKFKTFNKIYFLCIIISVTVFSLKTRITAYIDESNRSSNKSQTNVKLKNNLNITYLRKYEYSEINFNAYLKLNKNKLIII